MKKIQWMCGLLLLLIATACVKNNAQDLVTSITLTADKTTIEADGKDVVTFTAKSQAGKDLTTQATFTVDGKALEGNTFSTTTPGTYSIRATYKDVDSEPLEIRCNAQAAALTVSADKSAILANGKDKIKFTVSNAEKQDVSLKCDIYVDGEKIKGYTYSTTKVGQHKVVAKMLSTNQESEEFVFEANEEKDILLEADKVRLVIGTEDKATFTVTDKDGKNLTSGATFYINDQKITSNVFKPTELGIFIAKAEYQGNVSNVLSINVVEPTKYRIVLKASKSHLTSDGCDAVAIQAINELDNNNDLTAETTFSVNGKEIKGNVITATAAGKLTISAKHGDHAISPIAIEASAEFKPTPRVYIEDFTGTWCPYCPRLITVMEEAAKHPQVVAAGIHNGDVMASSESNAIITAFGVDAFPTLQTNRKKETQVTSSSVSTVLAAIPATTTIGVAATTTLNGTHLDGKVYIRTSENLSDLSFIAFITEDGIVADQNNAVYPDRGNPIKGMVHNHVYRKAITPLWGNLFSINAGQCVEMKLSYDLPSKYKPENCHVVFLITRNADRTVLASQVVKVGSACGY